MFLFLNVGLYYYTYRSIPVFHYLSSNSDAQMINVGGQQLLSIKIRCILSLLPFLILTNAVSLKRL